MEGGRTPIDDCVHCGFCLPVCPTYRSWAEEMDSPRGRIDLLRGLRDGKIALDGSVVRHLDRCLGCMACLGACPSGVRYDVLIEGARARVEREYPRPWADRALRTIVFALFPHPSRLRIVAALLLLYRLSGLRWFFRRTGLLRLSHRLARLDGLAPPVGLRLLTARLPPLTRARGTRRARVGLLAGCVQRVFFPGVNQATVRVLAEEGCDVVVPPDQGCCGALSIHAGREEEARQMARALIEIFEAADVEVVVVNAAGCGSHLKDCARLFAGDPGWAARAAAFSARVRDVSEFLAALPSRAVRHPLAARVAYHSSCHLGHAQRITAEPRSLLRAIPGLELVEIPDGDQCCGSAGIYNIVQPQSAAEVGARKAESLLSTRAELVASANPGCTLHLQQLLRERGLFVEAAHPVEILDASIRGVPLPGSPSRRGRGP